MPSQTAAPSSNNRLLGRGKWYFGRFNTDDAFTHYLCLGNAPEGQMSLAVQKLLNRSSMHHDNRILDEILTETDLSVSVSTQEFNRANLALGLLGTEAYLTQLVKSSSAVAIVADTDGGIVPGATYSLGYRNVAVTVVSDGTNTGVANVDYILDADAGNLEIPVGSNLVAGETLTVTFSATAITGTSVPIVQLATETRIRGKLMFIGDPAYGPGIELYGWNVSVSPSDAIALIQGNALGTMRLNFTFMDDSAGLYGGSASEPIGRLIFP